MTQGYVRRWNEALVFALVNLFFAILVFSFFPGLRLGEFDAIVILSIGISLAAFVTRRISPELGTNRRWILLALASLISSISWLLLLAKGKFTAKGGMSYLIFSVGYSIIIGIYLMLTAQDRA